MKRLLALSASAGSGKTFSLVARYLSLLFNGANPSEILAITFTNKAAGEMRERVISSLERMPPEMAEEIARMSGLDPKAVESGRKDAMRRFLSADLKIMTIDRFIHQILRRFCWYAGVRSDFEIAQMPKEEFFERFLQSLGDREYANLVEFARSQERKSQSFINFFEMLYEKDKELSGVVDLAAVGGGCSEDEAMEIAEKIAAFLLESSLSERGKKTMRFKSLADVVSKSWFAKESLNYWDYKKVYDPVLDLWLAELKDAVRRYYMDKERFFLSSIFSLYERYKTVRTDHMKRAGTLHFKDIEHLVYDLLHRGDFNDFLYFRLDARIGHILFDEFQDTSVTQYRIFEPVIAEIAAGGSERTLFYVGDTKQSIYRFRGGQKALFGYVAKKFAIDVEYLRTNYRSRSNIVEFVNDTFDYVKPRQEAHKKGGFVQVAEGDPLELLHSSLEKLFSYGVEDDRIAILLHDNKEILQVGEFIKERFGKEIKTHKRVKVTQQPTAKAMIEMMKLVLSIERGGDGALHRLNFLSLIGRAYDPGFMPDIRKGRPAFMLKQIMQKYSFFDEAAMKLLEFSIPLNDIWEFVDEVESYDEELPAGRIEGINVLTIHKSKGLEFDHLIVMDRLGKSGSDTAPVIFDYDGIKLEKIRVKFKNRDAVDPDFAEALEKEKKLQREDAMNRSYVAFTRAKESLFVLKREKSSVFDFLSLNECTIGELHMQERFEEKIRTPTPLSYTPKSYGRQQVSPEPEKYEANDYEAIYLGLGVHYLFETGDEEAFFNRYGLLCDIEAAKKMVDSSRLNREYLLLTEGRISRELPFIYKGRPGVVDLFVDRGESGVVIDYKTATPHDTSVYEEQLRRYKEALLHLMPEKRAIEAYIYFLDTQILQKVE